MMIRRRGRRGREPRANEDEADSDERERNRHCADIRWGDRVQCVEVRGGRGLSKTKRNQSFDWFLPGRTASPSQAAAARVVLAAQLLYLWDCVQL